MGRRVVRVLRDSLGWQVRAGEHCDAHLTKDEALLRARQWVLGEPKARIIVEDDGRVERDVWIGRMSRTSLA